MFILGISGHKTNAIYLQGIRKLGKKNFRFNIMSILKLKIVTICVQGQKVNLITLIFRG